MTVVEDLAEKMPEQPVATQAVEQVTPLIKSLPADKQQQVMQIVATATAFRGPLPPPEILERYGQLIPNGAERLMVLLEKQTDHRIDIESSLVKERVRLTKRGQWMAFGLSIFFGLIAAVLGYFGHDWLAGTIAATTIIGLATVFVLGKSPSPKAPTQRGDQNKTPT